MTVLLGLLACILVPALTGAATNAQNAYNSGSTAAEESLEHEAYSPFQGERFDALDWALCRNLDRKHNGNMLISPISIKLALALLYEGASGQTRRQLIYALQLPDSQSMVRDRFSSILQSLQTPSPDYALDISTRLYADKSINVQQHYISIIKTHYSTDVVVTNLSDARNALKDINEWVSDVTHGHVRQLLTDEEKLEDSVFLVLNALYFMGTWRIPFSQSNTRYGNFFTDINSVVSVSYMKNVGNYYHAYAPELDAQILRLPYHGRKYAMFVVLPEARTGLQQLLTRIDPYNLRRYSRQVEEVPVDVAIPIFKFEFTTHLENSLRDLGVADLFDNAANLIGIARAKISGQRLQVSDFVQKAGLEVNELGTTAYAVTEVSIGNKTSERTFHVQHPFLFYIEDETTGTIVFIGKVTNPLESSGTIEEPITRIVEDIPTAFVPYAALGPVLPVELARVEDRVNFFDVELLQALASKGDGNVVLSPASVKAGLITLLEGTGGDTARELHSALRLPSDLAALRIVAKQVLLPFKSSRVGAKLDLATRIWAGNNVRINPSFKQTLQQNYDSDVQQVNFADPARSSNEINNWVNLKTRGHIQKVVEPSSIEAGTRLLTILLLTNALYVKGTWKKSFDRQLTRTACFRVPNSPCQNVTMMHILGYYRYAYIPALDANVVEIPYTDERLSMLIILPESIETNINQLVRDLSHISLSALYGSLEETEVVLSLPRFSIETKSKLNSALETLGITKLFGTSANLSDIVYGGVTRVQVGSFLHDAKIEVDEEGTIATTIFPVVPLMGTILPRFRADRPFIFMIRDSESGGILLAGRVTKPDLVL